MSQPDQDRITDLLVLWERKRQEGTELTAEQLCHNDPDKLEVVRSKIAALKSRDILTGETAPTPLPTDRPQVQSFPFLDPPQMRDEIGRLAHYRVLKLLGQGGMGMVFFAEDPTLKRKVALKVITPSAAADPVARKRFVREARTSAAIENDHIVSVYQVGQHRDVLFLSMQLLQGESLHARLNREGTIPVSEALRIAKEVSRGLMAAHAQGLVHRDIKPANLWLDSQTNRTVILDFGLARTAKEQPGQTKLTQIGQIPGTPGYFAPEQADSQEVDQRTDIFSLGIVLYRMVTGLLPFAGPDGLSMFPLLQNDPTPPHEVDPKIPVQVSKLILQLMAKDPAKRPASAEATITMLKSVARQVSKPAEIATTLLTTVAPQVSKPPPPVVEPKSVSERKLPIRSKRGLWGGFFLVLSLLSILAWFIFSSDEGNDPPSIELIRELTGHAGGVDAISASPDGSTLISGGGDGTVRLWNVATGSTIRIFVGHSQAITCVCFTSDGKRAITGSRDSTLRVWDVDSGKEVGVFGEHTSGVDHTFRLLNGGSHALSAGFTGNIRAWRVSDQEELRLISLPPVVNKQAELLSISPDGRYALTGGRGVKTQAWDLLTKQPVLELPFNPDEMAFSPDGNDIITAGKDGVVQVWRFSTGKEIANLKGHQGLANVAVSPDSKRLLTCDEGGVLRLWTIVAGEMLVERQVQKSVRLVLFLDGQRAISAGTDGVLRLWKLP